ncbi:hypothetical protein SLS62_010356 [Diatrype stigma]|uniref:Uncharacterized protein n=1 Tax=Diatrype stigma TaxID=117547 RepID=A0AAN9UCV0_9PEZI
MHEAISATLVALDSLVTRQFIWSIFAELLRRAPECALTRPVLETVFAKLICADPNAAVDEERVGLLSWTDLWGEWAKALGKWGHKWEHKQDLFDLLADIRIEFNHNIFLFAIKLIAIGECYRAQSLNSIDKESCDTTKIHDIRSLEKDVFDMESEPDLLNLKARLESS